MTARNRIFKVTYTSAQRPGRRRRRVTAYMKVQYGGAYAMSELLMRMMEVGEVERYTIDFARPDEIAAIRRTLERWLPALMRTSKTTGVRWDA